jgi:hypothetical protein
MKQLFLNRIIPGVLFIGVYASTIYGGKIQIDASYRKGYDDALKCYQQWLIDVDYAEFNKKTGEWQLVDPNTIQGNLIEPRRRPLFVHVDDHIQALENELQLAKKQSNSLKDRIKSQLDVKKVP